MYCIRFYRKEYSLPEQTLSIPAGTGKTLREIAVQAGFDLRTHCGGAGTCKKCQLIVNGQHVLACQTVIESDLDVVVPNSSLRTNEQHVIVQTSQKNNFETKVTRTGHRFGIAIDIGTTTLAAELHDFTGKIPVQTTSCANPQRQFGDDVMTRIQKVMEETLSLAAMQRTIADTINGMILELTAKVNLIPQDVSIIVAAGNTVMQCLFFGIDPSPLGESPFTAPVRTFPPRLGSELGLNIAASGTVEALPIFGGFVGGDIVAGVLTLQKMLSASVPQFLLDIGTNGEMVLAHHGELFVSATAAGPAFEGAKIQFGTLAVPGAIDHVDIELGKIKISTISNQPAVGICGSGLIDAVAVLLELGVIKPSGQFAEKQRSIELVLAAETGIGEAIFLTQKDIRELQLAAGAIRAGITLLLQKNGVLPEELESFYVAGGFGQFIRLSSAQRIGLLPPIPLERFQFCGNTSLAGARLMLLNPTNGDAVRQFLDHSHHYELAMFPEFQAVFADSMRFD